MQASGYQDRGEKESQTRRTFLGTTLSAGLSLLPGCSSEEGFRSLLMATVPTLKLPPQLGEAYLRQDESEQEMDQICASLRDRLSLNPLEMLWLDSAGLVERLGRAIREDFADDASICRLQGWYVSRTECRLAALTYLQNYRASQEGRLAGDAKEGTDDFDEGVLVQVVNWRPRKAVTGRPFPSPNNQGSSFLITGTTEIKGDVTAYLNAVELGVERRGNQLRASLSPQFSEQLLAKPQTVPLVLVSIPRRIWQKVGEFQVLATPSKRKE